MVTANRAIFAVTVIAKTDRRQNAVRIVFGGSSDGVLPLSLNGVPAPTIRYNKLRK